jgi:lipid II:glycine glycyltransferase (peptidoglycan interpeptide bridge formation enzyme)
MMTELTITEWDTFLDSYPDAHLLQTAAWGELKASFGWQVARLAVELGSSAQAGAQVLFRQLPLGFSLAYIAKGPVDGSPRQSGMAYGQHWGALWPEVDALCMKRKAVFLKVEPDLWEAPGSAQTEQPSPVPPGFNQSPHCIQPQRTLLVDLRGEEAHVLARMKQKTRYNIRLALKKGVVVFPSSDLEAFYRLIVATGERDAFGVHSPDYYRRAYELFHPRGECELFLAEHEGRPLAALMAFAHGSRAWYFYGASADEQRERMPAYLLQWEAMRWARARGCTLYDLWGVPDADEPALEAGFTTRSDGLWGVYRFKRGFGGQLQRALGPWDRVYHPALYAVYRWWTRNRSLDQ